MRHARTVLITLIAAMALAWNAAAGEVDWETAKSERIQKPPESVTLEHKFPTESTTHYYMTVTGDGALMLPGQKDRAKLQTNSELTFVQQVMDYQPTDGVWRVQWSLEKGTLTIPDFGVTKLSLPKMEIETDKSGAIRSVKGLDGLASTNGLPHDKTMETILAQLKSLGFPTGPVKAGDSWDREYTISLAGCEPVAVKVHSLLESFERVLKSDCAKIRTTYEVPFSFAVSKADVISGADSDGAKALMGIERGDVYTHFAYADGRIVQSYGTIRVTADLRTIETKAAEASEKTVEEPKASEQPETTAKAEPHNLDVKYDLIMQIKEAKK